MYFFFFNDTATTEIYTLSLHDALPICPGPPPSLWHYLWTSQRKRDTVLWPSQRRPRMPEDKSEVLQGTLRSEEHTSELQSQSNLVCRLLLEKKKKQQIRDDDAQHDKSV